MHWNDLCSPLRCWGHLSVCSSEMYIEDQAWRKSFRSSSAVMCLEVLRMPLFPAGKKTE